jgi:hypothetical protein
MADFLEDRRAQLEDRLRTMDIAEDVTSNLPDEPRARILAIATVLRIDALKALRENVDLEQLEQEREERRQTLEQAQRMVGEAATPSQPNGEGG